MSTSKPNGKVIYRGSSLFDGKPIIVVAIGINQKSANRKTGNMIQTHILREDISPIEAIKTGNDSSICCDCKHQGDGTGKGRTCYVNVGQGSTVVWKTYKAGGYPIANYDDIASIGLGRLVRIGTYGDPAAVPVTIWQRLLRNAIGSTGYTHQWRTRPELKEFCMASADNEYEAAAAQSEGWRTFRVAMPNHVARSKHVLNEAICPASAEAGKKLTCDRCLACDGTTSSRKGSIVIQAHGGTAVMSNIRKAA